MTMRGRAQQFALPVSCRARTDDLGVGPHPAQVLAALADEPGLACLWGNWTAGADVQPTGGRPATDGPLATDGAGATVVMMSGPRAVSRDPAVLDRLPALDGDVPASFVGGGWVGWIGYDAPAQLAFYDHALRFDERSCRWSFEALWSEERAADLEARQRQLRNVLAGAGAGAGAGTGAGANAGAHGGEAAWSIGEFDGPHRQRHLRAVEQAIELIRAGDIYQVNVCTRMSAEFRGVPARLFAQAARELNPRFGAFIQSPDRAVLSLSPELFLRRHGRDVESSPIKGTWARDAGDPDDPGAVRLRQSGKDVAENVMIVDLVRNDLGRVCGAGTVQARQLLDVQPFPGVWHLVSTIGGDLRPDVGDADLIAATFPPGSVTGAPKVRALRAITELEDHPRGVYTGAVGLCAPASGLTLAVAIRTFEITGPASKRRIELGVGGGVTADSVPELEWRECAQKAAPLLRGVGAGLPRAMRAVAADPQPWQLAGGLLETMLAVDAQVLRLADHLARLERSCRELYRRGLPADLEAAVRAAVQGCTGRYAVRVVVSATGAVRVSATPASPRPTHSRVTVVPRAGVWRHKWADRSWVGAGETATEQSLYVAEDGSVLETSRGNVFLVTADGTVMTAPLRDDLLPGVTRRAVLDLSRDRGRPAGLHSFSVGELAAAQGAFWVSSISGPVAITALDGCPLPLTSDVRVFIETLAADLGFDCVSAAGSLGSAGSPASVASSKVLS